MLCRCGQRTQPALQTQAQVSFSRETSCACCAMSDARTLRAEPPRTYSSALPCFAKQCKDMPWASARPLHFKEAGCLQSTSAPTLQRLLQHKLFARDGYGHRINRCIHQDVRHRSARCDCAGAAAYRLACSDKLAALLSYGKQISHGSPHKRTTVGCAISLHPRLGRAWVPNQMIAD